MNSDFAQLNSLPSVDADYRFGRPHGLVRLSIIRSRLGDTHAERLAKAASTRRSAGHGHGHNLHN